MISKKVAIYAFLVCKILGPKIRSCKIFDKFQVCSANHEKSRIATKILLSCQFIGWSRKMGLMVYTVAIVSAIAIVYLCIMHICKSRPFKGLNLEFGLREAPMIWGILYKSDRRIPQHYFLQRLHVQIWKEPGCKY